MGPPIDVEAVVADPDRDFPALYQLFGGYFHQDWTLEYESWGDAAAAFVVEAPKDARADAASELSTLLNARRDAEIDEAGLSRLLYPGFDCNYIPAVDGLEPSQWLNLLRDAIS